jgi:DNA-directed RNA polymerase specialized sigma24 family protein
MQAQDPRTPWMDAADEIGHVHKALKGDRKALLSLLRHYHPAVHRLAFALTRNVQAAVAVTHAAVLKAKDGVRYMPEGQPFFPWFAGIVRNLARSRHRPGASQGVPAAGPRVAPGVVDLARRLLHVVDNLDPDEQAAIALRIAERLSYEQIETALRVAPGSALSLLAGARGRLTAQMQPGEAPPADHLTSEELSAHLDGALEGGPFDLVRMHLRRCEHCRLQCVRMASVNDVLRVLMTHDPDERFFEAVEGFLEEQVNAKDAAEAIPQELEALIAAEIARLEAQRWTTVSQAIPSPFGGPLAAVSEPPAPVATPAAEEAPAPRGADATAAAATASALEPATPWESRRKRRVGRGAPKPATAPERAVPSPQSLPAPVIAKPRPRPASPPRRDVVSRFIGAAIVALVLLLAGWYLNPRRSRPPAGSVSTATRTAGTGATFPAEPVNDPGAAAVTGDSTGHATIGAVEEAPAAKSPAAPETAAARTDDRVPREKVAATPPASTPARAAKPPAALPERGILCGQVRDESGTPVVRAQVLLADLRVGALTDSRGRFCISVPVGQRTVSVIALGFKTQRRVVTVARKTPEIAVTLQSIAVQEFPSGGER